MNVKVRYLLRFSIYITNRRPRGLTGAHSILYSKYTPAFLGGTFLKHKCSEFENREQTRACTVYPVTLICVHLQEFTEPFMELSALLA